MHRGLIAPPYSPVPLCVLILPKFCMNIPSHYWIWMLSSHTCMCPLIGNAIFATGFREQSKLLTSVGSIGLSISDHLRTLRKGELWALKTHWLPLLFPFWISSFYLILLFWGAFIFLNCTVFSYMHGNINLIEVKRTTGTQALRHLF